MNATAEKVLEVPTTILAQLGGRRFMLMTGAVVMGDANSLSVRFKGSRIANKMRVTLDPSDTYTVEFFQVRGTKCLGVRSFEGVYAEDLQRIFTGTTGLVTRLF